MDEIGTMQGLYAEEVFLCREIRGQKEIILVMKTLDVFYLLTGRWA